MGFNLIVPSPYLFAASNCSVSLIICPPIAHYNQMRRKIKAMSILFAENHGFPKCSVAQEMIHIPTLGRESVSGVAWPLVDLPLMCLAAPSKELLRTCNSSYLHNVN